MLQLIMQNFLAQDEHAGPPPTSEEVLKKLKKSKGKLSDVLRDVRARQKKEAGSAGDGGKGGAGVHGGQAEWLQQLVRPFGCSDEVRSRGLLS